MKFAVERTSIIISFCFWLLIGRSTIVTMYFLLTYDRLGRKGDSGIFSWWTSSTNECSLFWLLVAWSRHTKILPDKFKSPPLKMPPYKPEKNINDHFYFFFKIYNNKFTQVNQHTNSPSPNPKRIDSDDPSGTEKSNFIVSIWQE